ncbi:MAG: metallopeptidase family protein [Ktedonobacterales bacterium]|nr:metallopeptidase family protein [Ktedonobacterales bacterium]
MLGLAPAASAEAIRQAYRRLAKLWHPDRYATAPPELRTRAERRILALNRAYAVLSDPLARHVYDRDRRPTTSRERPSFWATAPAAPSAAADTKVLDEWEHATTNTNGAGQFVGLLCLILALGIFGGMLRGGIDDSLGAFLALGASAGIFLLALLFFSEESLLAHAAQRWAEGEPRGDRPTPPHRPVFDAAPAADVPPAAEAAADPEALAAARFEQLVDEALAGVPAEFVPHLANVIVRVEEAPSAETLRTAGVGPGSTLFGLYQGVPLTKQGGFGAGPEVITIFRQPIERVCRGNPARIRAQVRATVLHELAHHFGIAHEEMPGWMK